MMQKVDTSRLFIVLILACFVTIPVSAALIVQLDRDHISTNETVRLQVEIDRQVSDWLDTRPLEQDFDILANWSSSRANIVNGQVNATTIWTIELAPKRSGSLTVPSLELLGEHSRTLVLQVSDMPVAESKVPGTPILIETKVDSEAPYVQSMVRYSIRVYYSARLVMAEVSEPQLDNALVRQMGKDHEYTVKRGEQQYQVIERQYAIFPQRSGELVIPAPVLDGRIAEYSIAHRRRHSHFSSRGTRNSMFAVTRPVRIRGEVEVLSVQPRPDEAHGLKWLPAEKIELTEDWQPQDRTMHIGDPLKRTIVIRARGLTAEQLPDLDPGNVDGFKVYLDPADIDTSDLTDSIVGEKSRSVAFVSTKPGQFTLPAVNVNWWDTKHNQARIAQLPERTVEIMPTVNAQGIFPPSIANSSMVTDDVDIQFSANNGGLLGLYEKFGSASAGIWPWVSFLFALLWLVTVGMWWRSKRHQLIPDLEATIASPCQENAHIAKKNFHAACKANDPRMARSRLLAWAAVHWKDDPPAGLNDLARRFVDPSVKDALAELDRVLYREENHQWNGIQLMNLINKLPKCERRREKTPLPGLYT